MIGVLIVGGIIGYAMVYSGISELGVVPSIPPTTTLGALWPNGPLGSATASMNTGAPNTIPGKPIISTSSTGNRGRARTT